MRLAIAGCLLAVGLAPLALAQAGASAWDGKAATATATRLEAALAALLADPGLGSQQATAMQQREFDAAVASVREMKPFVAALVKRLESGYDREDSEPFWQAVAVRAKDVRAYAAQTWLPAETREKADRASRLLEELGRYYQ